MQKLQQLNWKAHGRQPERLRQNNQGADWLNSGITVQEILNELWPNIETTMAESEIGCLLQVVKASG